MTNEIHVSEAEVKEALSGLKNSIQALEDGFSPKTLSENGLEMANKFNEINTSIVSFLEVYHTLLINSEEMTRNSVDVIKETDANIASEIELLK